jgi:hypothetical protein
MIMSLAPVPSAGATPVKCASLLIPMNLTGRCGAPIAESTLRSDRQGSAKTLDTDPHRPKYLEKYSHTEAQGAQRKKKTKGFRHGFHRFHGSGSMKRTKISVDRIDMIIRIIYLTPIPPQGQSSSYESFP